MNLYELLSSAQGGQAMANLGGQFGLTEQQTADAVRQLLPAFSSGFKRNTETPEGLGALLRALNDGHHERYYDDGTIFGDPAVRGDGNGILGHLFGSKDVSRAVTSRVSEQTGIGADILRQMLPYIATLVMGALFKQGRNPLEAILGQVLGTSSDQASGNPFGSLAEAILGGAQQRPAQPAPTRGTDIFGSMLDADGDGSVMDDIFDSLLGGRR